MGYNFTAPIAGSVIPQRLQNLCIRDYTHAKGLSLAFTASEYWDYAPALMLFAQFGHGDAIRGFVFYSLQLLPADDRRRARFFQLAGERRFEVHFALEDLSLRSVAEVPALERIYRVRTDPRLERTREELLVLRRSSPAP